MTPSSSLRDLRSIIQVGLAALGYHLLARRVRDGDPDGDEIVRRVSTRILLVSLGPDPLTQAAPKAPPERGFPGVDSESAPVRTGKPKPPPAPRGPPPTRVVPPVLSGGAGISPGPGGTFIIQGQREVPAGSGTLLVPDLGIPEGSKAHLPAPNSRDFRDDKEYRAGLLEVVTTLGVPKRWAKYLAASGFPGYYPTKIHAADTAYLFYEDRAYPAVFFGFINQVLKDQIVVKIGANYSEDFVLQAWRVNEGAKGALDALEPYMGQTNVARDPVDSVYWEDLKDPDRMLPERWLRRLSPQWGWPLDQIRETPPKQADLGAGDKALIKVLMQAGLREFLSWPGVVSAHVPQDGAMEALDVYRVPAVTFLPGLLADGAKLAPDGTPYTISVAVQHTSRGDLDNQSVITFREVVDGDTSYLEPVAVRHTAVGWSIIPPGKDSAMSGTFAEGLRSSFLDKLRDAFERAHLRAVEATLSGRD